MLQERKVAQEHCDSKDCGKEFQHVKHEFYENKEMEAAIYDATQETNTADNWSRIIEVCEGADSSETAAREVIGILAKRVQHRNVNVVLFTLTLANALVQNCGLPVKREIASRLFLDAIKKQIHNPAIHVTVRNRILELVQSWAQEFQSQSSLDYMVDFYHSLKGQGIEFPTERNPSPVRPKATDREEEEYQLALALSISQQELSKPSKSPKQPVSNALFQVRALYDFPGTDEGELRLIKGDVVDVHDNTTYKDWWKGSFRGQVGIFPANYVEKLATSVPAAILDPEQDILSQAMAIRQFKDKLQVANPRSDVAEMDRMQSEYNRIVELRPLVIKLAEAKHRKQGCCC